MRRGRSATTVLGWLLALVCGVALSRAAPGAPGADAVASGRAPFTIDRNDPRMLSRAELAIVDSSSPPPDDAHWQPVQLPDSWRAPERYRQGINGWYRFRLPGGVPSELHAVYLWRFSMNAAVYFNGEFIGDGGSFDEPIARNWNRPLLFRLTSSIWRAESNTLMVRLRVYPGFGHMPPLALGPAALLQPDFERREFVQITLSQVSTGATVIALLAVLALRLIDRNDEAQLYFIGVAGSWFIYSLNQHLRDIPVSAGIWWWATHSAVDAFYFFLVAFHHRLLGVRRPLVERTIAAGAILGSILYAMWSLPQLARYNPLVHGLMSIAGLYLLGWLAVRFARRPARDTALYFAMFLLVMAAGVYDQMLNALLLPDLWRTRFYLVHLTVPILFFALIVHLALRVARGVQAVREANDSLGARVAAASGEIEASYARQRQLLDERSAADERERIYRDLHDNLGARLLSLVYSARDERQAGLARDALAEMRTIIAASHLEGGLLSEIAADWRLEAELRAEGAGYALGWRQEHDARVSSRQRYQLERVVRELVSNSLEHAGGGRIDVAITVAGDVLELVVSDDGRGLDEGDLDEGHGLASVRARVEDLSGSVVWEHGEPTGVRCRVRVALDRGDLGRAK